MMKALIRLTFVCGLSLISSAQAELPACVTNQPILFVVRSQYRPDHHNTASFYPAAAYEHNDGYFQPGGALKRLDAASGAVQVILETTTGVIRDPEVSFDGTRILFSMRKDADDSYHIYEIGADGTGLRQITSMADVDDLDPIYLPTGRIVFTSTREPKYIQCNKHISANLYAMDADGANVHQIARSALFEDHACLMPDGRILYSRWEYVDRNFGDAQGLWTCDPTGTGHAIYYGNNTSSPGGVLDGRPIPGTQAIVCTFSSCHDRPWGAIAILDRRLSVDGPDPVMHIWPSHTKSWIRVLNHVDTSYDQFVYCNPKYEDPYPLVDPDTGVGGRYFLCSRHIAGEHMALYLLDTEGSEVLLHDEGSGMMGCYDPMPLEPRPLPHDVTAYRSYDDRDGRFLAVNVYDGTHMQGVERGDVKYLRVVEAPEKRFWTLSGWGGQGFQGPGMNWDNFVNKRILGTVPVEEDGSAHFMCPPGAFVFFQLLDENKKMLHAMRSGTIIQPGESQGCIGCHEPRGEAPSAYGSGMPLAAVRAPNTLDGWYGPARDFGYLAEVQPVWDANCLSCHDWGGTGAGHLVLAGDKGLFFNASYTELWSKGYTGAIGAGPAAVQQARAWGTHASPLINHLESDPSHQAAVTLSTEEKERITTWLDLNAPYYPSYASAYPDNLAGRSPLNNTQLDRLGVLTGRNLHAMSGRTTNPGPQVCFDRPDKSPCLAGLTGANYDEALAIIQAGAANLAANPRADMPGFVLAGTDAWREDKYGIRKHREQMNLAAINVGERVYDAQPLLALRNLAPDGLDGVSADVNGEIYYAQTGGTAEVFVCWGTWNGGGATGNWQHVVSLGDYGESSFNATLTDLSPGQLIYFRVFALTDGSLVDSYTTATFDTRSLIDLDGDGMADAWERQHFTVDDHPQGAAHLDWDDDGISNEDEYWSGTDPTDPASLLAIEALSAAAGDRVVLNWQSSSNAVYTIRGSSNLISWTELATDLPATAPLNTQTVTVSEAAVHFFRITGGRLDR
jgi:hypothetical protein